MITYYLLIPILYFFAYLPSSFLYKIADVLAFVLRALVKYRKEVVFTNLRNSFPEKSDTEIQHIAKQSYTHLADRVVENIKCMTISTEEVLERTKAVNIELINNLHAQGKDVVLMVAHIASWEFGAYVLGALAKHKIWGIASKLTNPYFNDMVQRTRGKMGMRIIFQQNSSDFFKEDLPELSLGVLFSDQSPTKRDKSYWTTFLHQNTAFYKGAEVYAKRHNCAVVYAKIVQRRRGYYTAELIPITENPAETAEDEITEKFVRLLEQQLREHPSDWLWSHKRWKLYSQKHFGSPSERMMLS
jgi:KDO2-lipid IV(A) lauroyltransferase